MITYKFRRTFALQCNILGSEVQTQRRWLSFSTSTKNDVDKERSQTSLQVHMSSFGGVT